MRVRGWLDVCDIEVSLGPELLERSGDPSIHMLTGPPIRLGVRKGRGGKLTQHR